jgi:hypothetical protein
VRRSWARENGLTLFFTALFVVCLIAQALVGHADYNNEQVAHDAATVGWGSSSPRRRSGST